MTESYYELLGVSPNASESEIRQAYREQVKRHHPDVSDDPNAREKIMQIREAKEVLTDEQQRAEYDRRQTAGNGTGPQGASASPGSSTGQQRRRTDHDRWWTRTRASRWNRTRTREREPTASTERVDLSVGEQIEWAIDRLRGTVGLFVRAITEPPPNPVPFARAFLGRAVRSPTSIRLGVVALLVLTFTQSLPSVIDGYSPGDPVTGLGIVLISILISYAGYEFVSPLPFESPRKRERYKPAGKLRLWPIVAANLFSLGLIGVSGIVGAADGVISFGGASVLVFAVFFVVVPSLFGNGLRALVGGSDEIARHTTWVGVGLGMFLGSGLLFTQVGGDTFGLLIGLVGVPTATPWVDQLLLGPVQVGMIVNFLLAIALVSGLLWSVVAMCRDLTVAPWSDRYDHGYHVLPAAWNALLAAPFAVLGWMVGSGLEAIPFELPLIGSLALTQHDLLWTIVVLPTVLTGVYILRRRAEPIVREKLYFQPYTD